MISGANLGAQSVVIVNFEITGQVPVCNSCPYQTVLDKKSFAPLIVPHELSFIKLIFLSCPPLKYTRGILES